MDYVEHRYQYMSAKSPRDVTRAINFGLGLILIFLSLLFMFTSEVLAPSLAEWDSLILGLIGVLSMRASFSKKESSVYGINMFIGLLAVLGSGTLGVIQYFGPISWRYFTAREVTPPLLILQTALGVIFLAVALHRKRRRINEAALPE